MSKQILGIDISKADFSISLLTEKTFKHGKYTNSAVGFAELNRWLATNASGAIEIYMEATGRYGEKLADFLYEQGYIVRIINPLQIKSFSRAKLSRHKTDKVDAALIAEYGSKFEAVAYKPLPSDRKRLRDMYRCSLALQEQITYCINQLENRDLLPVEVKDVWEETRQHCIDKLGQIEELMIQTIKSDKDLNRDFNNLLSVIGIGERTGIAILAELGHLGDFKNARQLAAYIGLTPTQIESGSSVRGRSKISKMGNSYLRKALFFPAMTAIRHNEYFRDKATKLKIMEKKPKVIICAIMRKLVHVIYGILKYKEQFRADKLKNNKKASAQPVIAL